MLTCPLEPGIQGLHVTGSPHPHPSLFSLSPRHPLMGHSAFDMQFSWSAEPLILGALLRAGFPGPRPSLLLALAPLLHPARGWLPERGADYFCPWWGYSLGHPRVGKYFGVDRASVSAHRADPVPHPLTGGSI